jgi:hypothetical protein
MKFADLKNDGVSSDTNMRYPRFYPSKDEFIAYDNSSIAVQDAIGRQECAVESAEQEQDKEMEIARNLKPLGFAEANIVNATGLVEDEIEGS